MEFPEGEVTRELAVRHGIGYYAALDSLRKVYKEVGAERTPEHTGAIICYRKAKKGADDSKETSAVVMARESAKRAMNEYKALEIINSYRRR